MQSLLQPPAPLKVLTINRSSTQLNSHGQSPDDDIDKLVTTVTPEACNLDYGESNDDPNPLRRFDFEHSSETSTSVNRNEKNSDDNGSNNVVMITDMLTIDTKSIKEEENSLNTNYQIHTISPHEGTPITKATPSVDIAPVISPQSTATSQSVVHDNIKNADATTEEIPVPHTEYVSTNVLYPSISKNSIGAHHPKFPSSPLTQASAETEIPNPNLAPIQTSQPSAAQEALLSLRNTQEMPRPTPLHLIRGASLDSGYQYPPHPNNNTHIIDYCEQPRDDLDNGSLSPSENTTSDGEDSYFSEHLPSPKSHRQSVYGNRLPPGLHRGSSGGSGGWFGQSSSYWNRTRVMSDGGSSRNCPSPSSNLSGHPPNKFVPESDLSVSSSSCADGGDDGSVSTIGSACPPVQTHGTYNPFNAYGLSSSNTGYGPVGESFRNPNRPPMMPLIQQQGSHRNPCSESKNDPIGRGTPILLPRMDSMEPADDLPLSLTTTPSSHANSSETGNVSSSKSNRTKPRKNSTNSSAVSLDSDDLVLPSLQSGTDSESAQNGESITNISVVNVVDRAGLQTNDNMRNSVAGTSNNAKSDNIYSNSSKNKSRHRRQVSYCGSIDTGYRPDNADPPHLQQLQKPHRQRSNKILNPSNRYQGESDCDTVASDLSVDPPTYHPKKSRTRRHSDCGGNGLSYHRAGGFNGGHVPIEVKAPSVDNGRKYREGEDVQKSQNDIEHSENNVSPYRKEMTEGQKQLWKKGQSSLSPSRLPPQNNYSSPDRDLLKPNEAMPRSSNGSNLNYSEDDTDESTRFREMAAIAEQANRASGAGEYKRNYMPNSEIATSRDLVSQTQSPASDDCSKTIGKSDLASPSHHAEYDTSGDTHKLQQSDIGSNLHQEHYSDSKPEDSKLPPSPNTYILYGRRWLMLFWISLLNLLSDWTCYSVAPISFLTKQKFSDTVDPEALVTLFLAANALATALEPIVLARLGLRRTINFGAGLLMVGNIIKSGGIPGLTETTVDPEKGWKIYAGFLLVGLSQPLYQCTPALLSSSWFADKERTLATGVALNANQVGIGVSFIIGTTMVASVDDISPYFNLLSVLSILAFTGCFFQFSDAPPTPPSGSARIMRGSLEVNLGHVMRRYLPISGLRGSGFARTSRSNEHGRFLHPSLRSLETSSKESNSSRHGSCSSRHSRASRQSKNDVSTQASRNSSRGEKHGSRSTSKSSEYRQRQHSPKYSSSERGHHSKTSQRSSSCNSERNSRHARRNSGGGTRHRSSRKSSSRSAASENGFGVNFIAPSPTSGTESTADCLRQINSLEEEAAGYGAVAPSSMMSSKRSYRGRSNEHDIPYSETNEQTQHEHYNGSHRRERHGEWQNQIQTSYTIEQGESYCAPRGGTLPQRDQYYGWQPLGVPHNEIVGNVGGDYHPEAHFPILRHDCSNTLSSYTPYEYRNSTPIRIQPYIGQYPYHAAPSNWQGPESYHNYQQSGGGTQYHRSRGYLEALPSLVPDFSNRLPPPESEVDIGAEPIVTQLEGSNLNIEIRDDQVLQSIKACFSRPGFVHSVVTFAAGGVVMNTLSTYMDYLVQIGESDRINVGVVGFFFQMLIMISGMIVGKLTDKTRAYYYVLMGLLLSGAMILAECGVHLDADEGAALRWSLLCAAIMVGPLQPVATELGVDIVYPLSENTVLVIQQMFSNLLSALFIPFFRYVRDVGVDDGDTNGRPQYTFSFYLLIIVHAAAAVFFVPFDGKLARLEHEKHKSGMENNAGDVIKRVEAGEAGESSSNVTGYPLRQTLCNDEEQALLGAI